MPGGGAGRHVVTLSLAGFQLQPGSHTPKSNAPGREEPDPAPLRSSDTHTVAIPRKKRMTEAHRSRSYLPWPNLYEEAAAFVGNLQDFGPWEAVDSQFILVNKKAAGTDSQSNIHSFQVLRMQMRI